MDPCPFVRINIGNLALKFPAKYRTPVDSCYCKIKLSGGFATQFSTVPVIQDGVVETRVHACYTLKKSELEKMVERLKGKCCSLKIEIFSGRSGIGCGFFNGGKRVGSVAVALDLKGLENSASSSRGCVLQNGWVEIKGSSGAGLHVNVKSEPDPRFVFQFDGEPECSPQVFQVNGNVKQPVFSCKFSFRNGDRNLRSRFVAFRLIKHIIITLFIKKELYNNYKWFLIFWCYFIAQIFTFRAEHISKLL